MEEENPPMASAGFRKPCPHGLDAEGAREQYTPNGGDTTAPPLLDAGDGPDSPQAAHLIAPDGARIELPLLGLEPRSGGLDNQRTDSDGQTSGRPLSPDEINARMGGFDLLELAQMHSQETRERFSLLSKHPEPDKFSLLPTKGLRVCSRSFVPDADGEPLAKVWHRVDGGGKVRGTITGLLRCGSMLCPVCGSSRRRHAAELLQGAAEKWMGEGKQLAFVTLTVPHKKKDSARDVMGWVRSGWEAVGRSRQVKNGVVGFWRAMEWNYTRNGHHLHIHAVAFLHEGAQLDDLRDDIFNAWSAGAQKAGSAKPQKKAFEMKAVSTSSDLASYCNKVAYSVAGGLASEAARADEKAARGDGRSVMQLLADAANALTEAKSPYVKLTAAERTKRAKQGYADARVFHEIAEAMANRSWVHTPKAKQLRELFAEVAEELEAEKADGSDEAMKAKGWQLVRCMAPEQLAAVRRKFGMSSIIAAVLTSATAGDAAMALHLLIGEAFADGQPPPDQLAFVA
jgi:hypothetical protein